MSNRQIAVALNISYDTARRYSSQVRQKLQLGNVAALVCVAIPEGAATLRAIASIDSLLTSGEIEVLALACHGLSTKLIARQLAISPRTVDKHRQRILHKTGMRSIRTLTAWVAEQYALCGIAVIETFL
ncbi:helix-turn-helix transcriptional regulator [Janthinobacterium sp. ROICE36]|nr:helix-turn-helix transcriptional regulator [Janthinobacterium sp. ROICE36]